MTRKIRNPSPSLKFFPESSSKHTSLRKHHGKIPLENSCSGDYIDASDRSQSPYKSNEDEMEQSVDNDDASFIESESETNAPSDQSVPKTNNFNATTFIDSASNSPNSQAFSYMNIAPLPIFCGMPNECPITHLSRFTKVCRANNVSSVDMMMRIFPVTLENEAALWYDLNIEPYPSLSWEEIKSSFLEAYRKIELTDQLRYELLMINQGSEEPVRSYFLRLQWILKRWPGHGIEDNLLKGIFVDGLREDFQDWIIPQKPDSLNEALRLAFSFEQVKSIRTVRRKDFKCGFCEEAHEERDCEVRERMRVLWRNCKEKQVMCSLEDSGSGEVSKEIEKAVSTGECSSVVGKNEREDEKEEGGMLSGKKKSQCQCWKHQCGKKQLLRNTSVLTRNSDKQLERYNSVVSRNSNAG